MIKRAKDRGLAAWPPRLSPFGLALGGLTVFAFAIRLFYALEVAPGQIQPGDSHVYRELADALANSGAYNLEGLLHRDAPTASHPPLYSLYLAAFTKLGLASFSAHRAVSCLLGAAAVWLIGLLGRRVAGPRVGLVAAALAAVYPQLFMVDGTVIAESLYAPLLVMTLLLAYHFLDSPSAARAAALGATIGLATLTRSDGILLLVVLAIPLAWRAGRGRLQLLAVIFAVTALVLSPWLVRNWVRFDRFPLLSSNGALTQLATNCPATYYGDRVGFVAHDCALRSRCLRIRDEIPQSECLLREARGYVRHHLSRLPVVALARLGRLWNVYAPGDDRAYGQLWARERTLATIGMVMYAVLAVLAIGGALLLRRRGVPLLPLLASLVLAMLVALIAFGFSRYRLAAEPALVVFAAVSLQALAVRTRRALERRSAPVVGKASRPARTS